MESEPLEVISSEERLQRWLTLAQNHPPEVIAQHLDSAEAHWVVMLEEGPELDRKRTTAYLRDPEDLPYWAFALAKAYLDDAGEWPLFGLFTEAALDDALENDTPEQAVRHILATIQPVWPDVQVLFVGQENKQ